MRKPRSIPRDQLPEHIKKTLPPWVKFLQEHTTHYVTKSGNYNTRYTVDFNEAVNQLKKLRSMAEKRGLSTSGTSEQLARRIANYNKEKKNNNIDVPVDVYIVYFPKDVQFKYSEDVTIPKPENPIKENISAHFRNFRFLTENNKGYTQIITPRGYDINKIFDWVITEGHKETPYPVSMPWTFYPSRNELTDLFNIFSRDQTSPKQWGHDPSTTTNNQCCVDYIINNIPALKNNEPTRQRIAKELNFTEQGVKNGDFLKWLESHKCGYAVFDPLKTLKYRYAPSQMERLTSDYKAFCVFMINNNHVYPLDHIVNKDSIKLMKVGDCLNFIDRKEIEQHLKDNAPDIVSTPEEWIKSNNKVCYTSQNLDIFISYLYTEFNEFPDDQTIREGGTVTCLLHKEKYLIYHRELNDVLEATTALKVPFVGQSMGALFDDVLRYNKLSFPRSHFNSVLNQVFQNNNSPFVVKPYKMEEVENKYNFMFSIDCKKCHTDLLINSGDFPIYRVTDNVEIYKPTEKLPLGFYYIEIGELTRYAPLIYRQEFVKMNGKYPVFKKVSRSDVIESFEYTNPKPTPIIPLSRLPVTTDRFSHKWLDNQLTQYLLNNNFITHDNIKYFAKPSYSINSSVFKEMYNQIQNKTKFCKGILNEYVGILGMREKKVFKSFMTTSEDLLKTIKQKTATIETPKGSIFKSYEVARTELTETHRPIYQAIIDRTYIKVLEAYKIIKQIDPTADILAIKTDCVVIGTNLNTIKEQIPPKEKVKIGEMGLESVANWQYTEEHPKAPIEPNLTTPTPQLIHDYKEIDQTNNFLINAKGGLGKTYNIKKIIEENKEKDIIISTRSYQALEAFQSFPYKKEVIDALFLYNLKGLNCVDTVNTDILIIDEFFYLSYQHFRLLLELHKRKPNILIYAMGDPNQLLGVDGVTPSAYYLRDLFPNIYTLEWHNKARMTKEFFDVQNLLTSQGVLSDQIKKAELKISPDVQHLAFTNEKCDEINEMYAQAGYYHEYIQIEDLYIDSEKFGYRSKRYPLSEIQELKNKMKKCEFEKYFKPAYCITTDRAQGLTINKPVQIHEVRKFTRDRLYTAISRVANINMVTLADVPKGFYEVLEEKTIPIMKARKGAIYGMFNNGSLLYIGCSDNLKSRFSSHKNSELFKDYPNVEMKVFQYVYGDNLERVETEYIQYYQPPLNTNKKQTKKEKKILKEKKTLKTKEKENPYKLYQIENNYIMLSYYVDGKRKLKKFSPKNKNKIDEFIKINIL